MKMSQFRRHPCSSHSFLRLRSRRSSRDRSRRRRQSWQKNRLYLFGYNQALAILPSFAMAVWFFFLLLLPSSFSLPCDCAPSLNEKGIGQGNLSLTFPHKCRHSHRPICTSSYSSYLYLLLGSPLLFLFSLLQCGHVCDVLDPSAKICNYVYGRN